MGVLLGLVFPCIGCCISAMMVRHSLCCCSWHCHLSLTSLCCSTRQVCQQSYVCGGQVDHLETRKLECSSCSAVLVGGRGAGRAESAAVSGHAELHHGSGMLLLTWLLTSRAARQTLLAWQVLYGVHITNWFVLFGASHSRLPFFISLLTFCFYWQPTSPECSLAYS